MRKFHPSRIVTVCCIIAVILSITIANGNQDSIKAEEKMVQGPLTVKVVLQRVYLDGEISEEVTNETILSMEDFWAAYDGWQLIDQNEERVIFQRSIDDISPLLKTNGYFGIDDDGTLSIFNGKPETNEVIQSFFQIDVKKLESRKHDELIQGIRIQSRDQYLEVLKTLETYSKSEKK
jgi:forespore regulator of the sigma-K checkpoint